MKGFNILVVAIWLTIFFCSLAGTSEVYPGELENLSGSYGMMARVVYNFNETVWSTCHWCGVPNEPVRNATGTTAGETLYTTQDEYSNLADNRLTVTILRNTMPLLLMFMLAVNVAFYAGRGDIRRLGGNIAGWLHEKVWRQQILFRYLEYRTRRRSRKREEADTNKYHERLAEQRGLD